MKFEGQKKFEQLLREAECSRSVHEVYFFIRGLVAGTQVGTPSAWFDWIFDGKDPAFESDEQAQRLINNVVGLWNLILSTQHEYSAKSLPEIKEIFPDTVEGVVSRVKTINQRTSAFIKGLDCVGTDDPMEMTPDGRHALQDLTESDVLCGKYIELAKRDQPDRSELVKTQEILDKVENIVEDCLQRVSVSLDEARKIALHKRKMPKGNEIIARNEPCLCGSGKKYKKCCWLKLH